MLLDLIEEQKRLTEIVEAHSNTLNIIMKMFDLLLKSKIIDVPKQKKVIDQINFLFEEAKVYLKRQGLLE